MNREERIRASLTQQLQPIHLELYDDSARHAGHEGESSLGETHYTVIIEAPCFSNLSKVMRHRMVYRLLSYEFQNGLHGVTIKAYAPGEALQVKIDAPEEA